MSALYERWCIVVPGLTEQNLRVAFFRHQVASGDDAVVATALDALCQKTEQADSRAREVLTSAVTVLSDPAMQEQVARLREIAADRALLSLGRMLRRTTSPFAQGYVPDVDERTVALSRKGKALSLGERKAIARMPSRAQFDKLLRDPHPDVIRTLLANPRLTEEDVVRLAARRPSYPDILSEIAKCPRWTVRVRVRMALVLNPRTPPEVSVPMLSLLIRSELSQVRAATDVPRIVRAAASDLSKRRPPIAEHRAGPRRVQ